MKKPSAKYILPILSFGIFIFFLSRNNIHVPFLAESSSMSDTIESSTNRFEIANDTPNGPLKTKSADLPQNYSQHIRTTTDISQILKHREAGRLRTLKMVETNSDYSFYAVFRTPSNEEADEIRRLLSELPFSDYYNMFGEQTFSDLDSLLDDFGVSSKSKIPEYYIVKIRIDKADPKQADYKTIPVSNGKLKYDTEEVPSGDLSDYLNTPKNVKIFDTSSNGRFSEIIALDSSKN